MQSRAPQQPASARPREIVASAPLHRRDEAGEREADRMAARVLASHGPAAAGLPGGAPSDAGGGLPPAVRAFFEPRFGHDFGRVRVHTDGEAAGVARSVGARAFAVGEDVVFGAGAWRPSTPEGRRLIAHELAHVVTQRQGGVRLQKEDDFRVTGVQTEPTEHGTGFSSRFFFEFDRADFDPEVPEQQAEQTRIEAFAAAHRGERVDVIGHASEEGNAAHNRNLALRRARRVAELLRAGGVIVTSVRGDIERTINYRLHRSVDVVPTGQPTCSGAGRATIEAADQTTCSDSFNRARTRANSILDRAVQRLGAADDAGRDALLTQRFAGHDRTTIRDRVARIQQLVAGVTPECMTRCATERCDRPASGGGGRITICPPFYIPHMRGYNFDDHLRVFAVLHEGTHAADVGVDRAYSTSRLFVALAQTETLTNADSYTILVLRLADATGDAPAVLAARGTGAVDSYFGAAPGAPDSAEARAARIRLGQAQSWINYASFWLGDSAYGFINRSLAAWHANSFGGVGHMLVEALAPTFQIGHPDRLDAFAADDRAKIATWQAEIAGRGFPPVAATPRATTSDRTTAAGVFDRLDRMHTGIRASLTVVRASSGEGAWSSASGQPGVGTRVELPDFSSWAPANQVRHVIRLLARTIVPASRENAYVEVCDLVHRYRGLDPN